jgi:hypothetical protein
MPGLQTPDTQSSRRAVVMHAADLETVDGSFPGCSGTNL